MSPAPNGGRRQDVGGSARGRCRVFSLNWN